MTDLLEVMKSKLLDQSTLPLLICHLPSSGDSGSITYHNTAFSSFIGRAKDGLTGEALNSFLNTRSRADIRGLSAGAENTVQNHMLYNVSVKRRDGSYASADFSVTAHGDMTAEGRFLTIEIWPKPLMDPSQTRPMTATAGETSSTQQRVSAALDAYPDPFVIYDKDLRLVSWNAAYAFSMTDVSSDLTVGLPLRDVLAIAVANGRYPEAVGRESEWIDEIVSSRTLDQEVQDVELQDDIHHRLLRYRAENGDYVVIRLNSTELVRQRRTAQEAQARLIAALNAYPFPFVIYDSNDCIVVWNDAYRNSMSDESTSIEAGMHRTEVTRIAVRAGKFADAKGREEEFVSDEHQEREVAKPVQDIELTGDIHHRILRSRAKNGDLVIVRLDTTELVRQRRSVEQHAQELERINLQVSYEAEHDHLTGLGNRRLLKRKLDEFLQLRRRNGGEIAALHIDLDQFKLINDTMGHTAGDKVLIDVSKRILERVTPDEVVARFGGDEFVVLMHVHGQSARPAVLAKKLLSDLTLPTQFEGRQCRFGASIGIATTPVTSVGDLLTNSDLALYKAKSSGRGRIATFDQSDFEKARSRKTLADDVLRGLEEAEFVPYFQPQIDTSTGQVVGLEALARWKHPTRGVLSPDEFLHVASELDVVSAIDKIIFESAIEGCSRAFADLASLPSLSFNVSAGRVNDHDVSDIQNHLASYPGQVSFELLETIFLEEENEAFFLKLDQFRQMGLSIEVDDFGSGRASVVALQRIGPDRLKIDRRIVEQVTRNEGGQRLLKSIVEIGHAMEMGVTAEGVETQQQVELLTKVGCDRLQGYYISKPLHLNDINGLLRRDLPKFRGTYWRSSLGE